MLLNTFDQYHVFLAQADFLRAALLRHLRMTNRHIEAKLVHHFQKQGQTGM